MILQKSLKYADFFIKGTVHPFALSFPLLETQSYYWMVVQHSFIFPWDETNPLFTFFTSSHNDAKIVILSHCKRKCKGAGPNAPTDLSQISDSAFVFTGRNFLKIWTKVLNTLMDALWRIGIKHSVSHLFFGSLLFCGQSWIVGYHPLFPDMSGIQLLLSVVSINCLLAQLLFQSNWVHSDWWIWM